MFQNYRSRPSPLEVPFSPSPSGDVASQLLYILCWTVMHVFISPSNHTSCLAMSWPRLSPRKKERIIRLAQTTPCRVVADIFGCAYSTVSLLARRALSPGTPTPCPRLGRPPKASPRDISHIKRLLTKHIRVSPPKMIPILKAANLSISLSSLRRLMKALELKKICGSPKTLSYSTYQGSARRLCKTPRPGQSTHLEEDYFC